MAIESDLRRVRKISDPVLRKVLTAALKAGVRYRMMNQGIMIYGDTGSGVTIHFSTSDHRATSNAIARLRQIGLDLPNKKGQ